MSKSGWMRPGRGSREGVLARAPAAVRAVAVALAGVMAAGPLPASAGAQNLPVRAAAHPHKAKRLISLPTAAKQTAATVSGPRSPYARAAAQRADSGAPPPGHPHVLQHSPGPDSHPAG